jgi:hypothetical protein
VKNQRPATAGSLWALAALTASPGAYALQGDFCATRATAVGSSA